MKMYEIKVSLKGAKPPIWRKILIPENINFMQLHNIIQIAMGWNFCHLYEFTFKDVEERITNDIEACEEYKFYNSKEGKKRLKEIEYPFPLALAPKKTLFAKEVKIKKYFSKYQKFTYVYDFGDWWEHTVEILDYREENGFEFPVVTKFKRACPPEDCGGISGYEEFLEVYNNEGHPDYIDVFAWAEAQMYDGEYDIDIVNDDLESALEIDLDEFEDC